MLSASFYCKDALGVAGAKSNAGIISGREFFPPLRANEAQVTFVQY